MQTISNRRSTAFESFSKKFCALCFVSLAILNFPRIVFAQSETHLAAASELAAALQLENKIVEMRPRVFEPQLQHSEEFKNYKLAIARFYSEHMSYEALKPRILRMLTEKFSEAELRQGALFFSSSAGRKLTTEIPEVFGQINHMVFEEGRAHMDALKAMIAEEERFTAPQLSLDSSK